MDNFASQGQTLPFTAPGGGVVSGTAYLIGSLLVVATHSADAAATFLGQVIGAVDVTKEVSEVWTEGLKLYWDDTNKEFTLESGGNTLIGIATQPINTAAVSLATDADASDLLISGLTAQILDYVQLATDDAVVTVTINGVATALVEGTDWTAATDDDTTATSLAAAIEALDGVKASATTDTVTAVAATGLAAANPAIGRVRLDGAAR